MPAKLAVIRRKILCSHFAPQNKEENPLLAESSHFAPQNKEEQIEKQESKYHFSCNDGSRHDFYTDF